MGSVCVEVSSGSFATGRRVAFELATLATELPISGLGFRAQGP